MNKVLAFGTATVIGLSVFAAPAIVAAPSAVVVPTINSISTSQVKYPKAVPGRYCRASHRGDWTKTARYGKLKCKNNNGWRWVRV